MVGLVFGLTWADGLVKTFGPGCGLVLDFYIKGFVFKGPFMSIWILQGLIL